MSDDFFNKLQKFAEGFSGKLSILEEQVDIDTQVAYFKVSKKLKKLDEKFVLNDLPLLTDENLSEKDKKELLVKIALTDDPKAYRIIEEYTKNAPDNLQNWALMALQESKMLMESMFLDESQVFISTGLGGRDGMLRYFIVLIGNDVDEYKDFQKNMIKSEFDLTLKNNESELESVEFEGKYALITALIPFAVKFNVVLKKALDECNEYGGFLKNNFLVTNVKKLTSKEIDDIIKDRSVPDIDKFEDIDEDIDEDIYLDDDPFDE